MYESSSCSYIHLTLKVCNKSILVLVFFLTFTLLYVVTSNLSRSISKMKMEKRSSVRGGESNLRDAQPLVSQLHGFSGILHWFHRIPGLPVWTQACERHTEPTPSATTTYRHTHTQQLGRYSNNEFHFLSCTSRIFLNKTYNITLIENTTSTALKHTHTHTYLVHSCRPVLPVPCRCSSPG